MTSTAVGGAQPVSWRASGAALRVVLCHAPLFPTSCQQHAGLVASQWPICQDKLRTGSERGQKLDGAKIDSRERESPAHVKDRPRPQLCAKLRLCQLAARRASASSLPTGGAFSLRLGPPSAAGMAACARRRRHASASGWCETPWIRPDRRSSPAGPGLSAAPAAPERYDCTFRAPSEPGGLMRAVCMPSHGVAGRRIWLG